MPLCLTVDVEDWYDGMAEAGHPVAAPPSPSSGLEDLRELLSTGPTADRSRLTLFVVGKYCAQVGAELTQLAADGHEIASHGPDHGSPPEDPIELEMWLRRGREMVEEVVQQPVRGFRSPRFRIPRTLSLERYRDILKAAGFDYVSDRCSLGSGSAVRELPVFEWRGIPFGGGSYQRVLPKLGLKRILVQDHQPMVLYYHSYDFGVSLPSAWSTVSPAVLRHVVARARIRPIVEELLVRTQCVPCAEVVDGL